MGIPTALTATSIIDELSRMKSGLSAGSNTVLDLDGGDYAIDRRILINFEARIDGGSATFSVVDLDNDWTGSIGPIIQFVGDGTYVEDSGTLNADPDLGAMSISVDTDLGSITDRYVRITQANDIAYVNGTDIIWGSDSSADPTLEPDWDQPLREFLVQVETESYVSGTHTLTFAEEIPYDFALGASVELVRLLGDDENETVGVSGLMIDFAESTQAATNYSQEPIGYLDSSNAGWKGKAAIDFIRVRDGNISDVTINTPASQGLAITRTVNSNFDDITILGAQSRTAGNGYHFILEESFGNTATNLISGDSTSGAENTGGRHSLLFSSYSAEHNNNFHFTTATRDINFHGSIDSGNKVTIDNFDYSGFQGSGGWQAVHKSTASQHPRHGTNLVDLDRNGISDLIDSRRDIGSAEPINSIWIAERFKGSDDLNHATDDIIFGKRSPNGQVTLEGGAGNDRLIGSSLGDSIDGGSGNDIIEGMQHVTLGSVDTLIGGTGFDILSYRRSNGAVTVNLSDSGTNIASGAHADGDSISGFEGVQGSDFGDTLTGDTLANLLIGLGGDDSLNGGSGADTIEASNGADDLLGGAGNDFLYGGNGADDINGNSGNDYVAGGNGNDTIYGSTGSDTLDGGNYDDELYGEDQADYISGGGGNDVVEAGNGLDSVMGNSGTDNLKGNAGNDTLSGGSDSDTLNGGNDNDVLSGGSGVDSLLGGQGNDILNGNSGNDTLKGNSGSDTFVFDSGWGRDKIEDFSSGDSEKIDFSMVADISSWADFEVALDNTNNSSGNAVIRLNDGSTDHTIELVGVMVADIGSGGSFLYSEADFVFF